MGKYIKKTKKNTGLSFKKKKRVFSNPGARGAAANVVFLPHPSQIRQQQGNPAWNIPSSGIPTILLT